MGKSLARLEEVRQLVRLGRHGRLTGHQRVIQVDLQDAVVGVLALGAALSTVLPAVGDRVFGLGCVLTAAWLLRDDVGRRMIRTSGLRRFLPALWHATDDAGLKLLRQQERR